MPLEIYAVQKIVAYIPLVVPSLLNSFILEIHHFTI